MKLFTETFQQNSPFSTSFLVFIVHFLRDKTKLVTVESSEALNFFPRLIAQNQVLWCCMTFRFVDHGALLFRIRKLLSKPKSV